MPADRIPDSVVHAEHYEVTLKITVAGAARLGTVARRALRLAERLANYAARAADVLEVTATYGRAGDAGAAFTVPVQFAAANSGHGTYGRPDVLDRYVEPDYERVRLEARAANDAAHRRREDDRRRRRGVGCLNAWRAPGDFERYCECCYCAPADHSAYLRDDGAPDRRLPWCPCGGPVHGIPCTDTTHRTTAVVALDGDLDALLELALLDPLTRRP